jgi:L-alanine-DL-glutamate epimerase-like enolase superfamily enzyme
VSDLRQHSWTTLAWSRVILVVASQGSLRAKAPRSIAVGCLRPPKPLVVDGYAAVPMGPGLGIRPNEAAIRAHLSGSYFASST